jgi:hypothetical protein
VSTLNHDALEAAVRLPCVGYLLAKLYAGWD